MAIKKIGLTVISAYWFLADWYYSGLMVKTSFQPTGFDPMVQPGFKFNFILFPHVLTRFHKASLQKHSC